MRLYESLVPVAERFSPNQKKSLLESAIQPVKALRSIKDQADQLKMQKCNRWQTTQENQA